MSLDACTAMSILSGNIMMGRSHPNCAAGVMMEGKGEIALEVEEVPVYPLLLYSGCSLSLAMV